MKIFTIGYEGVTMDEFLAALKGAGVEQVIDVRALPLSRRPGFSKNILAATLKDNGIGYVHLKALGTPKPGRDAAKKGDWRTMEQVYAGQLHLLQAEPIIGSRVPPHQDRGAQSIQCGKHQRHHEHRDPRDQVLRCDELPEMDGLGSG